MRTFTLEEIRNYLLAQDSLGDALHNLNEKNIVNANETAKRKAAREQEEMDDLELEADEFYDEEDN